MWQVEEPKGHSKQQGRDKAPCENTWFELPGLSLIMQEFGHSGTEGFLYPCGLAALRSALSYILELVGYIYFPLEQRQDTM